jgi:eukaryotic-like serine/threonine-protein kinase
MRAIGAGSIATTPVGYGLWVPPVSPARISLPDRYRVVRHLANGGMAGVWEAHDELLGRSVAVKVMASHLSEDERARKRFQREARAAAGLSSHPHVVTIYDVGEHGGRVFMVMELMRGGTVGDRLKANRDFSDDTALRWLREAAGALDAAHAAGVVHRDVKPANLLLDDHDRLAIADFGIAQVAFEDQLTATGQVLGTAAYISPEQAVGEAATAASDRYALAVVAFELLTGARPFQAEHFAAQARAHVEDEPPLASERDPNLPAAVDEVLDRGLAKEPDERWESATDMVAGLERALHAAPATETTRRIAAPAPPPPPPPLAHARPAMATASAARRPGAALLAGLAGLVVLAVLGFILLSGGDGGRSDGGETASEQPRQGEREREREREPTATAEPTQEPTAEPTAEATAEPPPEATAEPPPEPSGEPNLDRAADFQLKGFNARQAGNYQQAIQFSQKALDACGSERPLSPCGYALFEIGASLNALGRSEEAIPYLEQRVAYGDGSGEAQAELEDARAKAGGGGGDGDD